MSAHLAAAVPAEEEVLPVSPAAPPPWSLVGRGLVLVLRAHDRPARGGLLRRYRTIAFVDYETSAVGPYRELLATSSVGRYPGATGPSVTAIWVTSPASAEWGNHNWGLTKSVAAIEREPAGGGERWTVADEGGALGAVRHRPWGPPIPVWKPQALGRLVQSRYGRSYRTPVSVRALVRPTRIDELSLDAARVIDLSAHRVVGAITVATFRMGFHAAEIGLLG